MPIMYALLGIALLFLLIKFLKWPIQILINGLIGVVLLYVFNLIGANFGFVIPINWITALVSGFLGIPGVILLMIFFMFL